MSEDQEDLITEDEVSGACFDAAKELHEYMKNPPTTKALVEMMRLCERVLIICAKYKLHPVGLAHAIGFDAGNREFDAQHIADVGISFADCDGRTCEATSCKQTLESFWAVTNS